MKQNVFLSLSLCAPLLFGAVQAAAQTPNFGPNVYIITPSMSSASIQTELTNLSNEAQFSTNRYAVFFMPGTYSVQAPVGYYEQIAGVGPTPGAVTINGFLTPNYGSTSPGANVTDTFWRSLENMAINPATDTAQSGPANTLQWGVSQDAPLRRMQINGGLELTDSYCGYASGGFISDTVVTGQVNSCSQQQWYTRNSALGNWTGSVWNMVFSGVSGAPSQSFPSPPYTVLSKTPVSREKPFLYVDSSGNWNVFVPSLQTNSSGNTWSGGMGPGSSLPISSFYIAQPSNTAAQINSALASGQNLLLTPGIYNLSAPIAINNAHTVVLGLGFADLIPQNGTSAITVADVDGVIIAGLIIDAGPTNSPVLMEVGAPNTTRASHQSDPTSLHDMNFRIGGSSAGSATTSLQIDSNNVIIDNLWAWRADHGNGVGWTSNTAAHGVIVNGDSVTALGLAVEHYQQNQVIWNGNSGETIFYQSEMPYDPPSQSAWMNGSSNGYASYAISGSVSTHVAYGLGVYSYFDQGVTIVADSAITAPIAKSVVLNDMVTVKLNGSGQITHVVNSTGPTASTSGTPEYLVSFGGTACTSNCGTAPSAPSNLSASAVSSSQINLTWTASSTSGVTYTLYRSMTSGFTPASSNPIATGISGTSYSNTGLTASTTYYYLVEAVNSAGNSPASNQASATTSTGSSGGGGVSINCGGAATGSWAADEDFSGGSTYSVTATINTSLVTNPAPQAVYQTARQGVFTYTIPGFTAGSGHTVNLQFAELYWTAAGKREFDVSINGTSVLTNFDIFAAAGDARYTAIEKSFAATANSSGQIVIQFSRGAVDQPMVNGISIQ